MDDMVYALKILSMLKGVNKKVLTIMRHGQNKMVSHSVNS
jgi:hypothetical protein